MRSRNLTLTSALRCTRTNAEPSSSSRVRRESSIRSSPLRCRTVVYFWSAKKNCTSSTGMRRSPSRCRAATWLRRSLDPEAAIFCSCGRVRRLACARAAASFSLRIGLRRYPTACASKALTAYSSYAVAKITAGGSVSTFRCRAASMPSIPGMRTSSSTTSGDRSTADCRPCSPVPASPTTSTPSISDRRLRRRSRASASSSTMRTFRAMGARAPCSASMVPDSGHREIRRSLGRESFAALDVWEPQRHDVLRVEAPGLHQPALSVHQGEALPNVGERKAIAFALALALSDRIADDDGDEPRVHLPHDRDRAAAGLWLDPVIDRILEQRLQHQSGDERVARQGVDIP